MIRTIEPDYYIKIGIKDNQVVALDWYEMVLKDKANFHDKKTIKKKVKKYLKKAVYFFKKKGRVSKISNDYPDEKAMTSFSHLSKSKVMDKIMKQAYIKKEKL